MPRSADYHVVPRVEREKHQYTGAQCWCEPLCRLYSANVRIFIHQTHLIDVLRVTTSATGTKA